MTIEIFERELVQALIRKGRSVPPNEVLINDAWNAFGHRQSDGFIETALHHLARNKETNLPTAFEQARIHAYQQRKVEQVESKGCTECGGSGWYYMHTLRRNAVWHTGGARQVQALDAPVVTQVAYRCALCNHGRVKYHKTDDHTVWDESIQQVINV